MTDELNNPMINFINGRDYYDKHPDELTKEIEEILENGSKAKDGKAVIVEKSLIYIRKQKIDIPTYLNSIKNQEVLNILKEELKTKKFTSDIITNNKLNFPYRQRYAIGTYLSANYSYELSDDIKKFISLNYEVGNINSNLDKVIPTL